MMSTALFFFQAEDGIRDYKVTGVQTCALPIFHAQVIAAREGRDPRVIARLFSGWAVFGERQFVRGYAVLLPDPVVPNLNALGARERIAFLSDMSRLGDRKSTRLNSSHLVISYAVF